MLTYNYTAVNSASGQKVSAQIEAQDEKAAAKILIERGLSPLEIHVSSKKVGAGFRHKVKNKDKVIFSRQLSTLMNAGLPLIQSLNIVMQQTKQDSLKAVISKVINDIEAGSSLAVALEKYPAVFNDVYVSLVAAGETSGSRGTTL
jgi:type IV pilus assembly protein PilC